MTLGRKRAGGGSLAIRQVAKRQGSETTIIALATVIKPTIWSVRVQRRQSAIRSRMVGSFICLMPDATAARRHDRPILRWHEFDECAPYRMDHPG
jgi:hypothetical protein